METSAKAIDVKAHQVHGERALIGGSNSGFSSTQQSTMTVPAEAASHLPWSLAIFAISRRPSPDESVLGSLSAKTSGISSSMATQ